MRRLIAVLAALTLACGDEPPTDPGGGIQPGGEVASGVTVEQGADQDTIVGNRFPTEVVARATDDAGNPVEGQAVNFETRTEGGPTWTASVLTTDAEGRVRQTPTAGTVAWTSLVPGDSTHTVELVASNEGEPDVVETFTVLQQPGPVAEVEETGSTVRGTESVEVPGDWVVDAHGNPALWRLQVDSIVTVSGNAHGSVEARTVFPSSNGTAIACGVAESGEAVLPMEVEVTGIDGNTTISVMTGGEGTGVTLADC